MVEDGLLLLEVVAGVAEGRAAAVTHRDHEVGADEDVDLAGLDSVVLVDVPECLEDEEQAVVVLLELGSLVRDDRVLDRERVELEGLGDLGQLDVAGS